MKMAVPVPAQAQMLVDAGLRPQILLPGDEKYDTRNSSYFDNSAKVQPICYLQPESAQQVATAVKALAASNQVFSVRGGGYAVQPGINNAKDGITIDLGLFKSIEYDATTETVHIGPGTNWLDVYTELEKQGRIAPGGRVAGLGTSGYLLGGGLSFYTAHYGFACDNVVAYEVVLGDGSIVTATAKENHDLFLVLKGGSNNFGIVTRFTLKTYPDKGSLWGGTSLKPVETIPTMLKAVEYFTANSAEDLDSSLMFVFVHSAELGGNLAWVSTFNAAGVEKPKIFKDFYEIPEILSNFTSGNIQKLLPFNELPLERFNIWRTLTIKNDANIMNKISELFFQLIKTIQTKLAADDFTGHCALQPLPRVITKKAIEAGGNVLGLDCLDCDALLLQFAITVKAEEHAEWVRPLVKGWVDDIVAFAGQGVLPWVYLSYASPDQQPLESYGAANLGKLRAASAKYDPNGVFQKLCRGGFKISAVKE